jgi:Mce-associated membrane protein
MRTRVNILLYVVVMVAAALLVVAAVQTVRDHQNKDAVTLPEKGVVQLDETSATEQTRYADVITSSSKEAAAFVNIRYDNAQASIQAVMDGATGAFRDQYSKSTAGVIKLLQQNKSIMTGKVLWAGVVAEDKDSATVIVATAGTVANVQTKNKPIARNFRLQLQLNLVSGHWLTSDLQFVA